MHCYIILSSGKISCKFRVLYQYIVKCSLVLKCHNANIWCSKLLKECWVGYSALSTDGAFPAQSQCWSRRCRYLRCSSASSSTRGRCSRNRSVTLRPILLANVQKCLCLAWVARSDWTRFSQCMWCIFQDGLPCHVSDENIKASLLMYFSYFVLFCKFFYDSYMSKMKDARAAKLAAASKSGEWG